MTTAILKKCCLLIGILGLGLLSLSACASPDAYDPKNRGGLLGFEHGYEDAELGDGRYSVAAKTPTRLGPEQAVRNALRRAVELTLEAGKSHLVIENEAQSTSASFTTISVPVPSFPGLFVPVYKRAGYFYRSVLFVQTYDEAQAPAHALNAQALRSSLVR